MTAFSTAASWLQNARITLQSAWFAMFLAALWFTVWALHRSKFDVVSRLARGFWATAMVMLVAMWLGGATLEMLRRAALVSGLQMVIALAAFSLLAAGTVSLAREWFGPRFDAPLRADKIALSLIVLTLAGWWFGGLALNQNALWYLSARPASLQNRAPDAWALLLGGAALLAASRSVRSRDESFLRVANPRLACWSLLGTALFLGLPFFANNPPGATVFALSAAVFGSKVWRVRADCPRFFRKSFEVRMARGILLLALCFWLSFRDENTRGFWSQRLSLAWQEPHQIAAWVSLLIAIIVLFGPLRKTWRLAIFNRFFDRALLHGTLLGFVLSLLFLGPGGAVFWAFWPLCGLFFDLLSPRESKRETTVAVELCAPELAAFEPAS